MNPKKLGKSLVCRLLEAQVKRLRFRNDFKLVVVAGSAGKTSTKLAIVSTLEDSRKVISQTGNYNDRLTVPLVLFGHTEPNIFNPFAWAKIFWKNHKMLDKTYPYEIAVLEIGTDAPGQLAQFAYLEPNLVVLTAIADEHMEFFGNLDAVAREELVPLTYSNQALLNTDNIPAKYLPKTDFKSYGLQRADYSGEVQNLGLSGQEIKFSLPNGRSFKAKIQSLGAQGSKIALAAVASADILGLSLEEITNGVAKIHHVAGRMQILPGKNGSTLIDDTYNAAPLAMGAAIDVLQTTEAPQRIAILGSMNELGKDSQKAHEDMGQKCNPSKLDLVVTIGTEAGDYLAPAALKQGCKVKSFNSPYEAGEFVLKNLQNGGLVLAKGSQNGVFAEEALKSLLLNSADESKLVRQSDYWLRRKQKAFNR